jgi:hypothetical protein
MRSRRNREGEQRMSKRYNKLWPDQARAKWLVQKKVQRGELVKPDHCQRCGQYAPPRKLQAHHHDYRRPTDVSWYCDACHKAIHAELGKGWKARVSAASPRG